MIRLLSTFLIFAVVRVMGVAVADETAKQKVHLHIVASDFVLPSKLDRLEDWGAEAGVSVTHNYLGQDEPADWTTRDLVIIDAPLRGEAVSMVEGVIARLNATGVPWFSLPSGQRPGLSGNLDAATSERMRAYYDAGGESNFRHLLAFIAAWKGGGDVSSIPAVVPMPEAGIYHPDSSEFFTDAASYEAWGRKRWPANAPRLAVIISSTYISGVQTAVLDEIAHQAEAAGVMPILFWFDSMGTQGIPEMIGSADVDLLASYTHMQNGDQRKAELEKLDVPAILLLGNRSMTPDEWRKAAQGVEPSMTAVLMATPESWGMGDPIVVSAVEDGDPVPLPEQIGLLVGKAKGVARLRHSGQADRKLALFFWNVPQGERNMSASNLNVPASVEQITEALSEAGYDVPSLSEDDIREAGQAMLGGYYHHERLEDLLAQGLATAFPVSDYKAWLDTLPEEVTRPIYEKWGAPEAHWAVRKIKGKKVFVIPSAEFGKLLFLPQPPRADKVGESYHDVRVPPGHLFLATYLMVQKNFDASAIIHLGTHGTQEWTPGKDRGLWAFDYPMLTLGNIPVIYPYIQDNVAEAIQAIRRGRAVTISHQTPPFAPSGFYDELRDIHSLIHEREQLDEGAVRDETDARLAEAVIAATLHKDLQWTEEDVRSDFAAFLPILHDHLHELAQTATPLGLHTFGLPASPEHRLMTVSVVR